MVNVRYCFVNYFLHPAIFEKTQCFFEYLKHDRHFHCIISDKTAKGQARMAEQNIIIKIRRQDCY